ncbi:protein starmaker isoform X7 [Penaeus vannamei]|uniref:protein starmaker isoform X7 n=1 Tax=Penaeus vannamei TaxID=6689 RepID=UPI00387F5D2E
MMGPWSRHPRKPLAILVVVWLLLTIRLNVYIPSVKIPDDALTTGDSRFDEYIQERSPRRDLHNSPRIEDLTLIHRDNEAKSSDTQDNEGANAPREAQGNRESNPEVQEKQESDISETHHDKGPNPEKEQNKESNPYGMRQYQDSNPETHQKDKDENFEMPQKKSNRDIQKNHQMQENKESNNELQDKQESNNEMQEKESNYEIQDKQESNNEMQDKQESNNEMQDKQESNNEVQEKESNNDIQDKQESNHEIQDNKEPDPRIQDNEESNLEIQENREMQEDKNSNSEMQENKESNREVQNNQESNPELQEYKESNPEMQKNTDSKTATQEENSNPDRQEKSDSNPEMQESKESNPETQGNKESKPEMQENADSNREIQEIMESNPGTQESKESNREMQEKESNPETQGNKESKPEMQENADSNREIQESNPEIQETKESNREMQEKESNPEKQGSKESNPEIQENADSNRKIQETIESNHETQGSKESNPETQGSKESNPETQGSKESNPGMQENKELNSEKGPVLSHDLDPSEVLIQQEEISTLKARIETLNLEQRIFNTHLFGPVTASTTILLVQVHKRLEYLTQLVESMKGVRGINDTLVVFSHDFWDDHINAFVQNISEFRVMQMFLPYSMQLHPAAFPGRDPRDCVWNMPRDSDQDCLNKAWPDKYGHYREPQFTQIKHHWWWKINRVFDELRVTKGWTGVVLSLEEDHYLLPDTLHVLNLLLHQRPSVCPTCHVIGLGNYQVKKALPEKMLMGDWPVSGYNLGYTLDRHAWETIKKLSDVFCTYDDYNWDLTLSYMALQRIQPRLGMLRVELSRVAHIGTCGTHFKAATCNIEREIEKVRLKYDATKLFPTNLVLQGGYSKVKGRSTPSGGWGDARDIQLCKLIAQGASGVNLTAILNKEDHR